MELIMKNNIVLYLPTSGEGVERYSKILAGAFGGCTIIPGCRGCWIDDKGILIQGNITLLKSFYTPDVLVFGLCPEVYARKIAYDVRDEFNQDYVSLEINGELFFI
jgi:hypothetical protein